MPPSRGDDALATAEPVRPHWLLRRTDQAALAGIVALSLAAMIGWWVAQGGLTGRLIDIDDAPPLVAAFQVNINEADWPELAQLPGIGETLAKRIVASRQAEGEFRHVDDLQRVRGIGRVTLDRLRPYLLPMPDEAVAAR